MARCQRCGAFVLLPYKCNYCGGEFCPNCRLPPDHNCAGIGSWRSTSAPHALVKMDWMHYSEPKGYMPPRTQAAYDDEADHQFYPRYEEDEGEALPQYHSPPKRVSIRRRLQRAYREIAYRVWRFWRYVKKNWFWILCLFVGAYIYLR